ncbi:hypothetical protein GFL03_03550 [Pseudomonas stutzeri]|nr:hypothetical protein [Stutzerimonas frequens]|tara:strand:- start:2766 stop:2969 length:204 start_codon:yes stop_codon:yes gene_type:complete
MHSDHRIDPDSAIEIDDPAARQTGFDTARRFDQQASQAETSVTQDIGEKEENGTSSWAIVGPAIKPS